MVKRAVITVHEKIMCVQVYLKHYGNKCTRAAKGNRSKHIRLLPLKVHFQEPRQPIPFEKRCAGTPPSHLKE